MSTTGILSILQTIDVNAARSFSHLYQMVGQNTGNLVFTNAVWSQIAGPKERVSFSFDPDDLNQRLDSLVIPAANWFSPTVDFSSLADLIERLKIPVIIVGLGAQANHFDSNLFVPEGTVRFVKAISERSHSLSVRGEYSKSVLQKFGINNVRVTGCPSLYTGKRVIPNFRGGVRVRYEYGQLHSTRYGSVQTAFLQHRNVHRDIYEFVFKNNLDILIQSEPWEMSLLTEHVTQEPVDQPHMSFLASIYGAKNHAELRTYIAKHAKLFFNVADWERSLEHYDYSFGTRLHATIMALNSGVPAILINHDSRTKEMAEFAGIPTISSDQVALSKNGIERLFRSTSWSKFYEQREAEKDVMHDFFRSNGVPT